jgi:hypothetical protein
MFPVCQGAISTGFSGNCSEIRGRTRLSQKVNCANYTETTTRLAEKADALIISNIIVQKGFF